jgi:transcriptional regulator with XRE-family HTH domain
VKGGDTMNKIGHVLKSAREKAGFTQRELSSKVGVSRAYYADVERGRYTPSLKVLSRLADILGIDLNFLKQNDGNTSE